MVNIKVRQNGPYLVEGDDVTLVDWNGNAYQIAKTSVRAVPLRRLDEQAVLRRHALEDRIPGGRSRGARQRRQARDLAGGLAPRAAGLARLGSRVTVQGPGVRAIVRYAPAPAFVLAFVFVAAFVFYGACLHGPLRPWLHRAGSRLGIVIAVLVRGRRGERGGVPARRRV